MISNHPLIIGNRPDYQGNMPLGLQPLDARHHCYIIGKTGSGKTTLLRNLIIQHIHRGHGIAIIDPHGDLSEELLHHIPPSRTDHLVYFNPSDLDYPVGFNLLANVHPDDRPLVASGIVDAFRSIWGDSWGPRMSYILHNAVTALLDCENTSLLGINRLLTDATYRRWVVRQVQDPFIRDYWEKEYEAYDNRFRTEAIAPIQNKIGSLLQSPIIRNILGQVRNKISIPFIMDNSRIFIANLSKGRMGHDKSNLLGSLLTAQFQLAAMARSQQPEHERRDFHLFIDEFQNFTTDAFASILAEARKYRLCLTLSHQYIDQLPPSIRHAVFGNIGSICAFRVGYNDAQIIASELGEAYILNQLPDLPNYTAFVRLNHNGEPQSPERIKTLPPFEVSCSLPKKLIARSRERFALRRSEVERKIRQWIASRN